MEVSVIIPAYNAASFLERAVKSALQHPEVKEVILIEDGSTDSTLQVCTELAAKQPKIKIFQHPKGENLGAGASRNLGIKNATQEFIAFLDADDYYTEIRFEREKEIFKQNLDVDGVYGAIGVKYMDRIGAETWENKGLNENSLTTVNKPINPEHLFEFLISINNPKDYSGYYSIDGLTLKRKSLLDSNVVFPTSLRLHQDTVFLWQTAYALKLYTGDFQNPIAIRGVHANNRFIHSKKKHQSRSKQYKVLRKWAIEQNLQDKVVNRFTQKHFKHSMYSKSKIEIPFLYLYLLATDTPTRKNFGKKQLKFIFKQLSS